MRKIDHIYYLHVYFLRFNVLALMFAITAGQGPIPSELGNLGDLKQFSLKKTFRNIRF